MRKSVTYCAREPTGIVACPFLYDRHTAAVSKAVEIAVAATTRGSEEE